MASLKVLPRHNPLDGEIIARFKKLPVASVSDVMDRLVGTAARIRPFHKSGNLVGPAVTVKTRPGDNLMIHKALDVAQPGDVVVVDGGGDLTNALIGELMVAYSEKRGLAGLVLDGAIRDLGVICKGYFPVYAAGVTHRGPYKDGPGEINTVVSVGGMIVQPGDLILGDEDGVIAVPYGEAHGVCARAEAKKLAEERDQESIKSGRYDRTWIDQKLKGTT